MSNFQLLKNTNFWKQNKTSTQSIVSGKLVESGVTLSYESLEGFPEPYTSGQISSVLPTGVKSTDTIVLYTEEDLKTHNDLSGTARTGDVVYFEDPNTIATAKEYIVFEKEIWSADHGFTLLTDDFQYYLCIRRDKLEV